MTDDVITLDVTWEGILWQMLSCCGLTVQSTYKIVKVIELFKHCLKGFWEFFLFFYYNYYNTYTVLEI